VNDSLAAFSPARQAMIIKAALIYDVANPLAQGGWTQTYRSPEDVRELVESAATTPCKWANRSAFLPTGVPPKHEARRRIFEVLQAEFGSACAACDVLPGALIDHEHLSGVVRGLLCKVCNPLVDVCMHAESEECRYAKYLNRPPAVGLGLRYPARRALRAHDHVRIAILGFDVLDRRTWPCPDPTQWTWSAPRPDSLLYVIENWWSRRRLAAAGRLSGSESNACGWQDA
jgi:hypothetical protein